MHDREADRGGQSDGFFQPCLGRAHGLGTAVVAGPRPFPWKDHRGARRSRAV